MTNNGSEVISKGTESHLNHLCIMATTERFIYIQNLRIRVTQPKSDCLILNFFEKLLQTLAICVKWNTELKQPQCAETVWRQWLMRLFIASEVTFSWLPSFPFQVELVTRSVEMTVSAFSSVWFGLWMLSWKLMMACLPTGTMVVQVEATDADDPTYGNSARVVYSIVHGQPYFSVEPKTGRSDEHSI